MILLSCTYHFVGSLHYVCAAGDWYLHVFVNRITNDNGTPSTPVQHLNSRPAPNPLF